jgi:sugar phosphate permease
MQTIKPAQQANYIALQAVQPFWNPRYTIILMCFAATFVCYIDRVNISVAIIPMAQDLGWDVATQGAVLSSFYCLTAASISSIRYNG